jgi:steroid delta-isomerase-like uncharacterized protein
MLDQTRGIEVEAAMSHQDNLRVIHEAFEAWNAHDVDRYAELLSEGYVEETHTVPGSVQGREAARAVMQEYLRVLPDLHFDLDIMVSSGDQVFTRWRVSGTYGGETSISPFDRRVEECGCTLSKLEQGKIIHVWHYWETDHIPPRHVAPH